MSPISPLRRLLAARNGSIAVEAALVLSLLMVLSLGAFDIVRYYQLIARIERAAFTTADLVARGEGVRDRPIYDEDSQTSDTGTYFELAAIAARPERLRAEGGVAIAALTGAAGPAQLHWSRGFGPLADGFAARVAATGPLPADIPFVAVEISLPFDTLILGRAGALAGVDVAPVLRRTAVLRPRGGSLHILEVPQ